MTDNLTLALDLAGRGWLVFPCAPDKKPITRNGFKDATTNPDKIRAWSWPLIGIYCKGSGFFALDIDTKNGVDGEKTWLDMIQKTGGGASVVCGPVQKTPSGGQHWLFKMPQDVKIPNNAGKLGTGLDLRSDGYICTGTLPDGKGYTWLPQHGPETVLTEAPLWLVGMIRMMNKKPAAQPQKQAAPLATEQTDPGAYWLAHYLAEAQPGNRNQAGFLLAAQLRDSGLTEPEARSIMLQFAAGVPGSDYTEREALASLASAYTAPAREPATLPATGHNHNGHKPAAAPVGPQAQPDQTTAQAAPQGQSAKQSKPTDDELRDRWIATEPLTAYGLGGWRRYAGGVWGELPNELIAAEVMTVLEAAKPEGIKPASHLLSSVMELARIKLFRPDETWDSEPDMVICKNGALYIPTMRLCPHHPNYYATGALAFDYDPAAQAPTWQRFLSSTIPDAANFLQEYAGYCLTVDTSYEMALWLYGPRGSGKSTTEEGFISMLGDRHTILGLADIERSRFSLWNLRGKTLAVASEQPALYMQSSHILNAIISGETLKVERKFRDPVDIRSHVKVMWAMNELPRVPDAGNGLFRRVKVIKFPNLAADKRDPTIKEKIKTEGAGILNWALEGLRRLRARGRFEVPASVQGATDRFQETNDIPAVFLADCCIIGAQYKIKSSVLYEKYGAWCLANGHKPKSSTAIVDDWERLGFERKKFPAGMFWLGVGLQTDETP